MGSLLVLHASADAIGDFELAASLALLPISGWYVYTATIGLRAPCTDFI